MLLPPRDGAGWFQQMRQMMVASIHGKLRAPVTALVLSGVLFSVMSGSALAATDPDPAKAFIASLAGKQEPVAQAIVTPSLAQPLDDPARLFIDRLAGKHEGPSHAVSADADTHPDQDFINRLGGRSF
ncbi:hypothetical protein [Nitrospirillum amazonense]|uniref:Uncharacterized protein n=1 Tax=Nitrospirillum amazonense TaxID=28077 RepID=A0A560K9Q4_9PROT|nr:hypothetical protein [Nitrospirillum amazonense]MDG3441450.1 hypothetical protein [Nitrospirillum amazonense]TWB80058.1 hypothetical protein FBZ87_102482 [Nitrospirillum amazonense]